MPTTTIHTTQRLSPPSARRGADLGPTSAEAGAILAAVIAILLAVLFFVYGLPALRGITTTQQPGSTDLLIPAGTT